MAHDHATVIRVKRRSKRKKQRINPDQQQQQTTQTFLRSRTFTVDLKQVPQQSYPIQRFLYDQSHFDNETLRTRSTHVSIRSQNTIGSSPTEIHSANQELEEEPKPTIESKPINPTTQSWVNVLSIFGLISLVAVVTTILVVVITTTNVNRGNSTTNVNQGNSTTNSPTVSVTTPISLNWNSTGYIVAGSANGTPGNSSTLLYNPAGLAIDSSDSLFITDSQNNRIQKYATGATSGVTVVAQVPGACIYPSFLYAPTDVLVDSSGNIYVSDTGCQRIRLWTSGSVNGTVIAGTGYPGSLLNEFYSPMGIARDSTTGTIYIADSVNNRIVKYMVGSMNGSLVAGGNGSGVMTNPLNQPNGLYFDSSSNSLIIANTLAHNIIRWNIGSSTGTVIAGSSSGISGITSELLNEPKDVTLDSQGNLYVADYRNDRVQLFRAGQTNGTTIVSTNRPFSIVLDSKLNIYVADSDNHRVQKFLRF